MIAGTLRPLWIELCQKAHIDPHELVTSHVDAVLEKVFSVNDDRTKVKFSRESH